MLLHLKDISFDVFLFVHMVFGVCAITSQRLLVLVLGVLVLSLKDIAFAVFFLMVVFTNLVLFFFLY